MMRWAWIVGMVLGVSPVLWAQNGPALPGQPDQDSPAGLPRIGELVDVVNRATDSVPERNWTTPVRLVIIFTGLALLPSLFVMMTSFTPHCHCLGLCAACPVHSKYPSQHCHDRVGSIPDPLYHGADL